VKYHASTPFQIDNGDFQKRNYERCLSIGKREEDFTNFISLFLSITLAPSFYGNQSIYEAR